MEDNLLMDLVKFENLHLRKTWDGKYKGEIKLSTPTATTEFKLEEEQVKKIILLVSDLFVESAFELSRKLAADLVGFIDANKTMELKDGE